MNKKEREKIQRPLQCLYEDLSLLRDDIWQPTEESCEVSLDNIRRIADVAGIELQTPEYQLAMEEEDDG